MPPGGPLPRFNKPPVVEVVHGVQFKRLPMTVVHPGLFYPRIRSSFPTTATVPPLAPAYEFGGPANAPFPFPFSFDLAGVVAEIPRVWFVSTDDSELVQIQADRLLLNWRRGSGAAPYPNFEAVNARFHEIYREFEKFCESEALGDIVPDQCEVTYINNLQASADGRLPRPAEIFRVWSDATGPEWSLPLDDLSFTARYVLRNEEQQPVGRVSVSLATLLQPQGGRYFQLQITVRGTPAGPGLSNILAFHAMAREHIVTCFAGLTTQRAHESWERTS